MKLSPNMFNPESEEFRYAGWTNEPTLDYSFNHTSGAFISFGEEEDSVILTHDKFDLDFFYVIDIDHFEVVFEKSGIELDKIDPVTEEHERLIWQTKAIKELKKDETNNT